MVISALRETQPVLLDYQVAVANMLANNYLVAHPVDTEQH